MKDSPSHRRVRQLLLALVLLFVTVAASAAPITFQFRFQSPVNSAQAVGSITFESTLLPNPGGGNFDLPDPAVLALSLTISGASAGNGTFDLDDFCSVTFQTNGGTLDLNQQLVGQPTSGQPWGTTNTDYLGAEPGGGDFNLFTVCGSGTSGSTPDGVWYFTLRPGDGNVDFDTPGANDMQLVSMIQQGAAPLPASVPVPTLDWRILLLLAALVGLIGMGWALRSKSSNSP